jgi:hypothetical protein
MSSALTGKTFNLQEAETAYNNLANAAPSAIKSDVQTIATAFSSFATALQNAHFKIGTAPTASQLAALTAAGKSLDTAGIKNAASNIAAWAKQNCS